MSFVSPQCILNIWEASENMGSRRPEWRWVGCQNHGIVGKDIKGTKVGEEKVQRC
jgi:hypothetical protein